MSEGVLSAALAFLLPGKSEERQEARPRRGLEPKLEMHLVRRARAGDTRAFAQIVRSHEGLVFDLCYRMLGGEEAEAEELAQDVFVSVYRNLASFKGESRLGTWIFRIAKNHCLNRQKYLSRRDHGRRVPLHDLPEGVLELPGGPPLPDRALESREEHALLAEGLEALDEEHRLLVVLRDLSGLSYEEIAAVTEQPEGTVKSRLHRARAQLAEAVNRLTRCRRPASNREGP